MKVVLTHGYFVHEDPKEQAIMRPYVPLGLLSVGSYLDEKGIANAIFDTTFSTMEALRDYFLEQQPGYIGFYVNLMTRVNVIALIRFVRTQDDLKDCVIFLGGPDVRYNADELLTIGADYLVVGEGEATTAALIECLERGGSVRDEKIAGLAWLDDGKTVFAPEREKIKDLDTLPVPNREKVDLQAYLKAWKEHHGMSTISLSSMRGCPYTCKWCSRAVYGLSYRRRSPALVVAEMKMLQERYQPDALWIVDDVFTVSHKWLREFADEVEKAGVSLPYECITRADRMNDEVIDLLRKSGCFRVWIGAESGSQKIIDRMDRRVEVGKVRSMIQQTQAEGIQAGTFIMLGYPGETEEDILETVHHLKSANPDYFTITLAYPIKGTELFEEVEDRQTHTIDFLTESDRDRDFERTYSRKYYDYAVRYVVNEVNFHKARLKKGAAHPKAINLKLRSILARWGMRLQRRRTAEPTA